MAIATLDLFAQRLAAGEPDPNSDRLLEQLHAHKVTLADAADCDALGDLAGEIEVTCASAVSTLERRERVRQHEILAFLAAVRDAATELKLREGESAAFLHESIGRLRDGEMAAVLKPFVIEHTAAMTHAIDQREADQNAVISRLVQRLTLLEQQLSLTTDETYVDALTRVANRRGFDLALEKRLQDVDPSTPLVLTVFDVDSLQSINEAHGHAAGDVVLRHVAGIIRQAVRPHDAIARIGGDEFALITSGLTLGRAPARLRQIIQIIAAGTVTLGGEPISVSCGAAEFSAGDTLLTLLHRADLALRDAKQRGKQSVSTRATPTIRSLLDQPRFGRTA